MDNALKLAQEILDFAQTGDYDDGIGIVNRGRMIAIKKFDEFQNPPQRDSELRNKKCEPELHGLVTGRSKLCSRLKEASANQVIRQPICYRSIIRGNCKQQQTAQDRKALVAIRMCAAKTIAK